MTPGKAPCVFLLMVWGAILFTGCATCPPTLQPLDHAREQQALRFLDRLRARRIPEALDVDIDMSWRGYGRTGQMAAQLQATDRGEFRLTVPDPLGRPLMLLVARSGRFTLVDNRQGRVYSGPVNNRVVDRYVPAPLSLPLIYSLLVDRIPPARPRRVMRDSNDETAFWYVFDLGEGRQRLILAGMADHLPLRQLLLSHDDGILLDLRYQINKSSSGSDSLPSRVRISGDQLPCSVTLEFSRLYPEPHFAPGVFYLRPPPSFMVETLR